MVADSFFEFLRIKQINPVFNSLIHAVDYLVLGVDYLVHAVD